MCKGVKIWGCLISFGSCKYMRIIRVVGYGVGEVRGRYYIGLGEFGS